MDIDKMKKKSATPNTNVTNITHHSYKCNIRANVTGGKTPNQIFIGTF